MKKEILYNIIDRKILIDKLNNETFKRKTCSFYKYVKIVNPKKIRDDLYLNWSKLEIFGRIYISKEGINAQLSCPIHNWKNFIKDLNRINIFKDISIKEAIVDGQSFYKLTIKVRDEIVSYGLQKNQYDMKKTGKHINSHEFNKKIENIVVNIGAAKEILTSVAKGNSLKAIKIATSAINPDVHLNI